MTPVSLLSAAAALHSGARLDPLKLFLDADIVVQAIMAGLLLASVWVWTIVLSFGFRMASLRRRSDGYETEFWKARDLEAFQAGAGKADLPLSRVVAAGMGEWRRAAGQKVDLEGARQRLAVAMDLVVAQEAERLGDRLNFLATVGSVAPFVGLFGTVWGIMAAFFQIGQEQNSSLAVVAPGIAEALAATAIGLFAAIPAVIAYNRFSHRVNAYEARMQRFADKLHASLGRDLESR
ncbi:MAG: protein TolQ [Sphingomonadales bacterium]|nr:protein TolQ [Sphingomonadales bacterium]